MTAWVLWDVVQELVPGRGLGGLGLWRGEGEMPELGVVQKPVRQGGVPPYMTSHLG